VAYANRDFVPGERICSEFPAVWVYGHHPFTPQQVQNVIDKVEQLDEDDKRAFYEMANVFSSEECHPAIGIFMTNSFDMTDSIYGTCCAMYLALARLNHSCVPNTQQTHLPDTTEEVLYASRAIKCGEEINDCYIDLRAPREERRAELLQHYRFHCLCPGCDISDILVLEQDDRLRSQAAKILDDLAEMIEKGEESFALEKALSMCKQLAKSTAMRWSVRYLAELFLCVRQIALSQDNKSIAKKYLAKAHQLNLLLQGPQSPDSLHTKELIDEIR
jgi:hypothetical protein